MVPFLDLGRQYAELKEGVDWAVANVLASSQFVLGSEVAGFEEEFAGYCGVRHAIGVSSGTSALHLALVAAGIGPGDEVITVPFTFCATVAAIEYVRATPVLVDIDPLTFNIDTRMRCELAATYQDLLAASGLELPAVRPEADPVWHLYTIRTTERDRLQQLLGEEQLEAAVHYPAPVHLLPAYRDQRYPAGSFPVAEACARTVLSLPLYPGLSHKEAAHVADRAAASLEACRAAGQLS